jgi:branched-chain amino acid transport system substrate-binding protein
MKRFLPAITLAAALASASLPVTLAAATAESLKIGFLATLSGPLAVWGQHMRDGFLLGVKQANGRLGGRDTEVLLADAGLRPDRALTEVQRLVQDEKVDIVAGVVFSNVMLAVHQPIVQSGTIFIGTNAGPAQIAGKGCNRYFFSTSFQEDQNNGVMGRYAAYKGYGRVVVMAPNYFAGRNAIAAFKRHYNGDVVSEIHTRLGQMDFSDELAHIMDIQPDAVFTFMPGGMGVQLVKQYASTGLKDLVPLLSTFTIDEITLRATKDLALGHISASPWTPDLDNPANIRFVRDFRSEYGYEPSHFAAQGYDAARLIDGSVDIAGYEDREALVATLETAPFESVRGDFRFNNNHFPVQDFYAVEAVHRDRRYITSAIAKVFDDFGDPYSGACRM